MQLNLQICVDLIIFETNQDESVTPKAANIGHFSSGASNINFTFNPPVYLKEQEKSNLII